MRGARVRGAVPLFLLLLGMAALVGCGAGDRMADLRQYVAEVKARPAKPIEPLPEFKPYATYAYQAAELRDPFEPLRVHEQTAVAQEAAGSGLQPDFNRPRELLEMFPLDSMRMVGILERGGQMWGLVQTSDTAIHRIREGSYLGQNYGKVTRVAERQVDLVEIVPNGQGGWMERQAELAMKE